MLRDCSAITAALLKGCGSPTPHTFRQHTLPCPFTLSLPTANHSSHLGSWQGHAPSRAPAPCVFNALNPAQHNTQPRAPQDMEHRTGSKDLELVWRGSPSFGGCADVLAHNYFTGNYGPPDAGDFFFEYRYDWKTIAQPIVVRVFLGCVGGWPDVRTPTDCTAAVQVWGVLVRSCSWPCWVRFCRQQIFHVDLPRPSHCPAGRRHASQQREGQGGHVCAHRPGLVARLPGWVGRVWV